MPSTCNLFGQEIDQFVGYDDSFCPIEKITKTHLAYAFVICPKEYVKLVW